LLYIAPRLAREMAQVHLIWVASQLSGNKSKIGEAVRREEYVRCGMILQSAG
jgi:hypothetical protein